jgi:23S rRNA pseudouridine2604 synthase
MEEKIEFPVRINKYLALKKICSRKEADLIIAQKKVKINGRIATLGEKVGEKDNVTVDNLKKDLVYYAFNKPKNIITHSPQRNEKSIEDIIKTKEKVYPIGRLDKESQGLIILTNDGRITDRMLNPEYNHEKEYQVKTDRIVSDQFIKLMANGVTLDDGYVTKKCTVKRIDKNHFSIILTEGKKRQIRRMCNALRYNVLDLKRVRIMNIQIGTLQSGKLREIKGKELNDFYKLLDL